MHWNFLHSHSHHSVDGCAQSAPGSGGKIKPNLIININSREMKNVRGQQYFSCISLSSFGKIKIEEKNIYFHIYFWLLFLDFACNFNGPKWPQKLYCDVFTQTNREKRASGDVLLCSSAQNPWIKNLLCSNLTHFYSWFGYESIFFYFYSRYSAFH